MPLPSNSFRRAFAQAALGALAAAGMFCHGKASAQAKVTTPEGFAVGVLKIVAQFTTWPAKAFSDPDAKIVIGVLGPDPLARLLNDVVRGESGKDGRGLAVKRSDSVTKLMDCQIIFIGQAEAGRMREILQALSGSNILTVSDTPNFCRDGGMVGLKSRGGTPKFDVNLRAARDAGVRIHSNVVDKADQVIK